MKQPKTKRVLMTYNVLVHDSKKCQHLVELHDVRGCCHIDCSCTTTYEALKDTTSVEKTTPKRQKETNPITTR